MGNANGFGYVPALDGLRGIAIALVVGYHFVGIPPGGQVGVDVFFVLSGFLITGLLLDERAKTGRVSLRVFYARRARRLLPALALMLSAFVVIGGVRGEDKLGAALIGASYVGNMLVAYGSHYGAALTHNPIASLWSLAEEEQFYLLWPPLLLLIVARARRPARWLLAATAALALYRAGLALAGHSFTRIYFGPDTHSDGLLIGCALAFLWRSGFRVSEAIAKAAVVTVTLASFVAWLVPGWAAWGTALVTVGCFGLVAAAVSPTEFARGLTARPLVWLGRRSYSLYLWHLPALWLVGWGYRTPLSLLVALVAAEASYRWVELPFRRRRDRPASVPAPASAAAVG